MRAQATEPAPISSSPVAKLRIALDPDCEPALRDTFLENPDFFEIVAPAQAELVILHSDALDDVRNSALYQQYKSKAICITESDIPTFRLPGLYAANQKGFLTAGRTRTMNYFISQRAKPNPEIKALAAQVTEKRYLYSFMGGTNSWPRRWLFRYTPRKDDTIVEPTDKYNHWSVNEADVEEHARQMRRRYADVMAASKFSICPRGCGLSSYRLFESMSLGVAPVIISDPWRPVAGVDWSFAIFLPEKDIPKLDEVVRAHAHEWQQRGEAARAAFLAYFSGEAIGRTLHGQLVELRGEIYPWREAVMGNVAALRAGLRKAYWAGYHMLKKVIIRLCAVTGVALPFRVYQAAEQGAPDPKLTNAG